MRRLSVARAQYDFAVSDGLSVAILRNITRWWWKQRCLCVGQVFNPGLGLVSTHTSLTHRNPCQCMFGPGQPGREKQRGFSCSRWCFGVLLVQVFAGCGMCAEQRTGRVICGDYHS